MNLLDADSHSNIEKLANMQLNEWNLLIGADAKSNWLDEKILAFTLGT